MCRDRQRWDSPPLSPKFSFVLLIMLRWHHLSFSRWVRALLTLIGGKHWTSMNKFIVSLTNIIMIGSSCRSIITCLLMLQYNDSLPYYMSQHVRVHQTSFHSDGNTRTFCFVIIVHRNCISFRKIDGYGSDGIVASQFFYRRNYTHVRSKQDKNCQLTSPPFRHNCILNFSFVLSSPRNLFNGLTEHEAAI